jgi:hypothetical protein
MKRRSLATNGLLATWLPCIALAAGSVLAALAMALQPPASGPIAVVFPPWWSATRALVAAASAGTPVRFGATGFVVVVMPDTPDAAGRLRHAGAWAVLDPLALGGCVAT